MPILEKQQINKVKTIFKTLYYIFVGTIFLASTILWLFGFDERIDNLLYWLRYFCYGLLIGSIIYFMYFRYIKDNMKAKCPICGKAEFDRPPHIFRKKGKIYRVHQGDCANTFLYGVVVDEYGNIQQVKDKRKMRDM